MTALFLTHGRRVACTLALSDFLLVALGLFGLALLSGGTGDVSRLQSARFATLTGFVPLQIGALYAFGLLAPTTGFKSLRYGARLAGALLLGLLGLGLIEHFYGMTFDPSLLAVHVATLFCLLFAAHWIVLGWAAPRSRQRRLAIVGERSAVLELAGRIRAEPFAGYSIVSICVPTSQDADTRDLDAVGEATYVTHEVGKLLGGRPFDAIAFDPRCKNFNERDLCQLAELSGEGVAVYDLATLSKGLAGRFPRGSLDTERIAEAICARNASDRIYGTVKRGIDIVFAAATLLVFSLPMLLVALVIKLDSRGPVLVIQPRVGFRGRIFRCYKFRTMSESASREGPEWTEEGDPRITRVGRYLRKVRFDELPQLFNVLRGDMSVVGPRPVLATIVDSVRTDLPLYHMRHTIRPGLTGWAQVKQGYARGKESELAKLRYDLYYIEKRSLLFDFFVLVMTARIVIGGAGR